MSHGCGSDIAFGVKLLEEQVFSDERGDLVAFESMGNLPFRVERVFFMQVDRKGATRGGHANSCHELIVPVSGSVLVELDNGYERVGVRLDRKDQALWIRPGILIDLRDFARGTVLLVFASHRYGQTRHYDRAQPHLIMAACAA